MLKLTLDNRTAVSHNRSMSEHFRFMSEIFRIVNGALRLDTEKVRNYTAFLAEKLQQSGDEATASRLRKLLEETNHQLRPTGSSAVMAVPVDSESRFPLLERLSPGSIAEPPLILDEDRSAVVREFVSVAKSQAQIESQGVAMSLSMIVCGPPGTGKSRLARHIAAELGLDLYVARLDGLISSFLGSTSKNIRALFDFAAKTPCVLFLDEFDALAKLRGDTQELGELKRVVNSFIQNLDTLGQEAIIIAATNHEELLDSAVWRRFTYRLELPFPGVTLRQRLWKEFLPEATASKKVFRALVDLSEGFSGADIQEVCMRARRKQITENKRWSVADAFTALRNVAIGEGEERRAPLTAMKDLAPHAIVRLLRKRNEDLYSADVLATLLGVSKTTAHRWAVTKEARNGRSK